VIESITSEEDLGEQATERLEIPEPREPRPGEAEREPQRVTKSDSTTIISTRRPPFMPTAIMIPISRMRS